MGLKLQPWMFLTSAVVASEQAGPGEGVVTAISGQGCKDEQGLEGRGNPGAGRKMLELFMLVATRLMMAVNEILPPSCCQREKGRVGPCFPVSLHKNVFC